MLMARVASNMIMLRAIIARSIISCRPTELLLLAYDA
jgi:hypothetical protein